MTWQNPSNPFTAAPSFSTVGQSLGGGSTTVISPITPVTLTGVNKQGSDISQWASYEIQIATTCQTGDVGILRVTLQWYNQITDTVAVDQVTFDVPQNTTTVNTGGHGPMRGSFMAVSILSEDANSSTISLFMNGSTRTYTNDDWRSNGVQIGNSNSSATPFTNELCVINNATVAANSAQTRGVYLYSGQAFIHCDASATGTLTFFLADWQSFTVAELHPGENGSADELLIMPRKVCTMTISNSSGTASGIGNVTLVADRV
jgi:hypothetical protein